MRYFIDTEFHESRGSLELISIGIAAEDGRSYYRENFAYDRRRAHPWLRENVLPHLGPVNEAKTLDAMASEIQRFVDPDQYGKPEFWGYFADYDWVVFCWIFGSMIELPEGFPMFCMDLKQEIERRGISTKTLKNWVPEPEDEHHALADARWIRDAYSSINRRIR